MNIDSYIFAINNLYSWNATLHLKNAIFTFTNDYRLEFSLYFEMSIFTIFKKDTSHHLYIVCVQLNCLAIKVHHCTHLTCNLLFWLLFRCNFILFSFIISFNWSSFLGDNGRSCLLPLVIDKKIPWIRWLRAKI